MFGIIRPCRHRLSERLHASWMAHLCGLCLALRDDHGQLARTATNYDGLVISVLVEAQSPKQADRRTAGPCPLRGMRTAPVARGEGARLAAAVSLALASVKVRDHVEDGDGLFARRTVAAGARRVTRRWDRQSTRSAAAVGFDTAVLLDAAQRQQAAESAVTAGAPLLLATAPTEEATAAAFAHTATLAGRPRNAPALAEAGRLFGRLAHLLDAAEDREADEAHGLWNPLTTTGTSRAEAERLCRDAVHGIRLALKEVEFTDRALAHLLLAHETGEAVDRVFGRRGHHGACANPNAHAHAHAHAHNSPPRTDPHAPSAPNRPDEFTKPKQPRSLIPGCAVWMAMACTCQLLCCDHDDPFSRERREGFCQRHDCDCGDGCDGCDCCCDCCGDDGCCSNCDCCGCDC
ncbi:hypothetical protein HUT16_03620 [Kitasatospora sp. NA04385]|uniref:DUF5685 family protein n=1 Tax=Kitasatospora sp. NA04385 TaxID=2742135 RepID=UPI001592AD63|nr:DUF5685 family protein [Kitasatospora sp. NA04385]QKW18274.1 hypothetical protein HUT16_03620 [Kitasatospora sp. NA04385]